MKRSITLLFTAALTFSCAAQVDVAVITLNDFHAGFVRNDEIGQPGAAAILHTVDSLKRAYPAHVVVSAGDNFGGSYFYQATRGTLLPVFFDRLGLHISALGNHEFDEGQRSLSEKWANSPGRPEDWDITYVAANVRSTLCGRIPDYAQPVASVPVRLANGKTIRVAFLGLTTSMTPQQTSTRNLGGLSFDGRYDAVIDSVMHLPEATLINDAAIRLVLTHIGTATNEDGIPVWDDRDGSKLDSLQDPIWDGFITAHTHEKVAGYIGGRNLPVVQAASHGRYLGLLVCSVDTTLNRVTRIEPHLIPVVPPAKLSPAAKELEAMVDSLLENTRTAGGTPIGETLAQSEHALSHSREKRMQQTRLGTLVCQSFAEAYRKAANLDDKTPIIGCSHFGSIRAGLPAGTISVLDVGEALPFSNKLKVYNLTGDKLIRLIDFGINNTRFGRIQIGNLRVITNGHGHVSALIYHSPSGHQSVIQSKKHYTLVADEFMTNGGDGYDPAFFPEKQEIKITSLPATTDAFINHLKKLKKI